MKQLVLGMFVAAIASQAAGCIFVSDNDNDGGGDGIGEEAVIRANWDFVSVAGTNTGCGPDVNTIAVITTEVNGIDQPIAGTELTDLYDCVDGTGVTDPLPPARILVYLEARFENTLQGQSLSEYLDITNLNVEQDFTFISDGGRFVFDYALVGENTGAPLTCAQADASDVGLLATVTGGVAATDDLFPCTGDGTGFEVSDPILAGSYTVVLDAVNANNEALGTTSVTLSNVLVGDINSLVDLGAVDLDIAGL